VAANIVGRDYLEPLTPAGNGCSKMRREAVRWPWRAEQRIGRVNLSISAAAAQTGDPELILKALQISQPFGIELELISLGNWFHR
jgi:hypothetical protein